MQSLDVISVNIWQIVISLCNLVILFFILKRFLYKPVKKMMAARQAAIDEQYAAADEAKRVAEADQAAWAAKMQEADSTAEGIIKDARETAEHRSQQIVAEAHDRAEALVRQAETDAQLERRKAEADIKREIVDVSTELTEKMLGREIQTEDHRAMIDSFLEGLGGAE